MILMKRAALLLVLTMAVLLPQVVSAQDTNKDANEKSEKAREAAFDKRVFAGPVGKKASACFVRRYNANHLAQHPKQKVAAMKLLVTAENHPKEPTVYAYKVGVQFRNKPANFDGGSSCSHMTDEDGNKAISFSCDVECGGGGLEVAMSKDDKSAIVKLEVIGVYDRQHPKRDAVTLEGGVDDKVFRLDRVDSAECADLTSHREVASLQRK
jgi:hypothetical protein